jgi:plastocyanin
MEQGAEMQLVLVTRDRGASSKLFPGRVSWSSSAPSVAIVNSTGFLTGIAPGTAAVSATVTIGDDTRSAVMTVTVLESVLSDTVVFTAGTDGWQPKVGHVKAGGVVEWRSGGVSDSKTNGRIWLLDMNYAVLDSLDSNNGSVTHRFSAPGAYRFCSGSCWDPPDFGIIYSH